MRIKKPELVIFDLDGTLADAYEAVTLSLNAAIKKYGLTPVSYHEVRKSVGWGETTLVRKLVPAEYVGRVLQAFQRHHRSALRNNSRLLPGAREILDYLRSNGYRMSIATNRPKRFTMIILKALKIDPFFEFVLCGDEVMRPKPSPEIIRVTLKEFSLKASDCLYVGDMALDVAAGKSARVRTVAVSTGSSSRKELLAAHPDFLFRRISRLKSIL